MAGLSSPCLFKVKDNVRVKVIVRVGVRIEFGTVLGQGQNFAHAGV